MQSLEVKRPVFPERMRVHLNSVLKSALPLLRWVRRHIFMELPLTPTLLYVCFHLLCLAESQTGRWGRFPPGRGEGGGADALVAL